MEETKLTIADLSCPICLDLYKDPIVLPCKHIFCKFCLDTTTISNRILQKPMVCVLLFVVFHCLLFYLFICYFCIVVVFYCLCVLFVYFYIHNNKNNQFTHIIQLLVKYYKFNKT